MTNLDYLEKDHDMAHIVYHMTEPLFGFLLSLKADPEGAHKLIDSMADVTAQEIYNESAAYVKSYLTCEAREIFKVITPDGLEEEDDDDTEDPV